MSSFGHASRRFALWVVRLLLVLAAAILICALVFALGALRVTYPLRAATKAASDPPAPREIRGAIHIHSTLSDGRGTPSQIALAAKAAGLQFIIMTDHNLRTLTEPTYEHGVLVISGVELSTKKGHLVVIGTPRGLARADPDAVRRSQELGGIAILAHPVQRKAPWTDARNAMRADGMELYSADSLFRDALHRPFTLLAPAAMAYLTNPIHALMILNREQPDAVRKLLEISARRPKLALCAHDSHGFPPYELAFRSFSVHIPLTDKLQGGLPADPSEAAGAVIDVIARGGSYCAFDPLGPAEGFAIDGLRGESRRAAVGDRLTVQIPPLAAAPVRVQIWGGARLEPDGRTVVIERGGPLQIEVWVEAPAILFGTTWKPWIVPSPVFASMGTASSDSTTVSGESSASSGSPATGDAPGSR